MARFLPAVVAGALVLAVPAAGQQRGDAAWRCVQNLVTAGECGSLTGPLDLRTGTTLGGSPIGGGGVSDGNKGDVTVSGSGATWNVDSGAVAFSELSGTASDAQVSGSDESDEITGITDAQISDTLTASTSTTASANDNDTSIATTAFVQQEIDDGDLLTDNCALENDSTPIPDSCVGDGSDAGGGGGGLSYAEVSAAALAGF